MLCDVTRNGLAAVARDRFAGEVGRQAIEQAMIGMRRGAIELSLR
jgi:hypothetical protein